MALLGFFLPPCAAAWWQVFERGGIRTHFSRVAPDWGLLKNALPTAWRHWNHKKLYLWSMFKRECQIDRHSNVPLDKLLREGPWWWSSGQRSCLLLWRSEFESCWLLNTFSVRKDENKRKRGWGWPTLKKLNSGGIVRPAASGLDSAALKKTWLATAKSELVRARGWSCLTIPLVPWIKHELSWLGRERVFENSPVHALRAR